MLGWEGAGLCGRSGTAPPHGGQAGGGCCAWMGPLHSHRWRGGTRRSGSLSPTGPSLSLFGHLPVLQHHVGDEHSHKQEQQEADGQGDGDSIGSGQKVLVDDMLAIDEWLVWRTELW